MGNLAPIQSGSTNIGAVASPVPGTGPGIWRVRIRNTGPVSVRIGDDSVDFTDGFLVAPDDDPLELLTDSIVYACAPPNAAGIGQARIDYITETR